jgi:hypothetical protein
VSEGDDLPDVRSSASAVEETPPPAPPAPAVPAPHARRFQIFTGILLALAIAAVSGAILVAATGGGAGNEQTGRWSAFKPSSDGLETGAREIADYVGRQYVLPTGQQIVLASGGPLEIEGLPMHIAVRHSPADGGKIDAVRGRGVLYRLCGLGPNCAITSGKASPARALLLYRESLELALYSFHDLDDVDNVVVFQPPKKGQEPTIALLFRRGDVAGQLARPLRATLPNPVPTPDTIEQSPDRPFIEAIAFSNIFKFSLTQANQDRAVFLVLDPVPTDS